MPTITLTEEQVIALVDQLPAETRASLFVALLAKLFRAFVAACESREAEIAQAIKPWCAKRGLDWDALTEDDRMMHLLDAFLHEEVSFADEQRPQPEEIVREAMTQHREVQTSLRERAVHIITYKNNLATMAERSRKRCVEREADLVDATKRSDQELAAKLRLSLQPELDALEQIENSLVHATAEAEAIKKAIQRQEEFICMKIAEAMAFEASLKSERVLLDLETLSSLLSSEAKVMPPVESAPPPPKRKPRRKNDSSKG